MNGAFDILHILDGDLESLFWLFNLRILYELILFTSLKVEVVSYFEI